MKFEELKELLIERKLVEVKKIYQDQDKWDKVEELCLKKAKEYK